MILYHNKTYWVQSHYEKAVHLFLNLQHHVGSPQLFGGFRVAHLFIYLCQCFFGFVNLRSVFCTQCRRVSGLIEIFIYFTKIVDSRWLRLTSSLDSPFLIAPLVFLNFLYIL